MNRNHLLNTLKALALSAAVFSVSAYAAPIFSDAYADGVGGAISASVSQSAAVANAPLFSHMGVNGGHQLSVAFLGDDNSILIGHYSRGPWSKNEFLRSWQNIDGGKDFVPTVETVAGLPEPSTLALLVVSALAFGALLRRRQLKLSTR